MQNSEYRKQNTGVRIRITELKFVAKQYRLFQKAFVWEVCLLHSFSVPYSATPELLQLLNSFFQSLFNNRVWQIVLPGWVGRKMRGKE